MEVIMRSEGPKLLRVVARLVLLAAAVMYLPWPCSSHDAAVVPMTVRKISQAEGGEFKAARPRRLLSIAGSRKEALEGLEDALLEQPEAEEVKKINYLPDLAGDDWLAGHPRRVFVDVVSDTKETAGRDSEDWFGREYPKKGAEFETVKVELAEGEGGGIGDWLEKNVRAEEFVVMKADADVVEEMVRENVVDLVDELFWSATVPRGGPGRVEGGLLGVFGTLWKGQGRRGCCSSVVGVEGMIGCLCFGSVFPKGRFHVVRSL